MRKEEFHGLSEYRIYCGTAFVRIKQKRRMSKQYFVFIGQKMNGQRKNRPLMAIPEEDGLAVLAFKGCCGNGAERDDHMAVRPFQGRSRQFYPQGVQKKRKVLFLN